MHYMQFVNTVTWETQEFDRHTFSEDINKRGEFIKECFRSQNLFIRIKRTVAVVLALQGHLHRMVGLYYM